MHVHSEYSLLDGCAGTRALPARAAALGMSALALTDHGVLHGAVQFCRAAKEYGVKPIVGCELYVVTDTAERAPSHHLTVLAADARGYRNLCLLSSKGFLEGFYYRPRVTKEQLETYGEGLIVLSGCIAAEVPSLLIAARDSEARAVVAWYLERFGPDRYFLELMDHGLPDQRRLNEALIEIGREFGVQVVATNDAHYLHAEDASVQDVLLCVQTGKRIDDPDRLRFESDQLFLKSPQEMLETFSGVEDALKNTLVIADRCDVDVVGGGVHLPGFPDGDETTDPGETLRRQVMAGLAVRYPGGIAPAVLARVDHELAVIDATGFTEYFLIVWDLIRFARGRGIAVGPGRGSSASSMVAYALEITDVDPLAYGLLFERFLNPERVSMPDIDMDFCFERRHEVLEYAAERFGRDRVAQICTFGTLAARAAVRDVGRVLNLPYADVDRIAKLIPTGPGVTLQSALQESADLRRAQEKDAEVRRLLETSARVEGKPRHISVHAAGIVIAPTPLAEAVPLCKTADGTVVSQFVGEDLESLGFLKMDLLGLRTLTVISKAVALASERSGVPLDVRNLPLDDEAVYEALSRGETEGIFQLETSMFQNLLRDVQPRVFDDLIAILSLGRPGPMARLSDYLRYRRGEATPEYPHPALGQILDETCGVMLYQEQVMKVATELAGYTAGQADLLRRAMGKKLPEIMQQERARFVAAAVARGMDAPTATAVFEDIARFAEYGFPKSHSAAYALVAYQSAYLKVHYPAEFMAAQLASVASATGRATRYIEECRRLGIPVKGPDVNASAVDFAVKGGAVRFGLASIKNVGKALAGEIVRARESAPFHSLEDFCARVPSGVMNRKALDCLVRVGAFDALGITRAGALGRLDDLLQRRRAFGVAPGQIGLFGGEASAAVEAQTRGDGPSSGVRELSTDEILADEISLLGTYVSVNPLDPYREILGPFRLPKGDIPELGRTPQVVGGVVTDVQEIRARGGRTMAFAALEDLDASPCELVLFPDVYGAAGFLRTGTVLIAKGRMEEEEGKVKLIADSVRMLEGEPVVIVVKEEDALGPLKEKLLSRAGGRPVLLELRGERTNARLALPPKYWVDREYEAHDGEVQL